MEKYGTARQAKDNNVIRRTRLACRITKATDTHSEYAYKILIAFPRQKWFRKRALILRYTYIVSVVKIIQFQGVRAWIAMIIVLE